MCGIAGLCNWKKNGCENIERMKTRMVHRGPDGEGTWYSEDASVVLGHRRLSVIDLSKNGSQPMISNNGRFVIAYNGEIYNYKQLADKLLREKALTQFCGTSDTEVLLEAFAAYGVEETISQCKGMFAIALYDRQERILYLLRDRVGEKPLYYGMVNEAFVFASDIGCISALDNFQNPINTEILDLYFTYGYIPAPYSIYRGIYKLEPGTILKTEFPFQEWNISEYWSMKEVARRGQQNLFTGSFQEATEELERLLKESVTQQMAADVPVGAFLSAGIDSSTIVALMQSVHRGKVRSFTIGIEEEGYNEAVYAKEIARHLGTEHTELYITKQDVQRVIPGLSNMFGEPFADSSQIPTYLVSKMTREHVTVSLSGDGGDELFCGYNDYALMERLWNKVRKIPEPIRKPCSTMLMHSPWKSHPRYGAWGKRMGAKGLSDLYIRFQDTEPLAKKISLNHGNCAYQYSQYENGFLEEVNHNIMLMNMLMYHPDDILVKVDRTAMAVSLETRVPMLDRDVVEFAWTLPITYKREAGIGKKVLRNVLYRYVPEEMMERPKKGFSIPIAKWLREPELRQWAEQLLNRDTIRKQGLLDAEVVWNMWTDFIEKGQWRIQIWYILMFQEWMEGASYAV